jgi:aspartate carbamoyltransferase catalytic subunit
MSQGQFSSNYHRCSAMLATKSLGICTVSLLVAYLMLCTFGRGEIKSNEVQDVFHSRTLESNVQCLESIPGNRRITLMGDSRVRPQLAQRLENHVART